MPIGSPEVRNCIPIMVCHISLQCHHPVHLQSCSLPVSQFFSTARAVPGTRGALTENLPLAQFREEKELL